ncbi:MAG: hypothetical protein AMJ56_06500 [Anaerolineae bacterium SG8_19]|nr:MAG: hypothetical protein AMJ56_06500 [Anaerolineae bacterium SG8_19]
MVIDGDEDRRAAYAAKVKSIVAPISDLNVSLHSGTGWSAVWAAAKTAPVDFDSGSGGGALVWGEARDATGELQTAASIRMAWRDGAIAQWDGFYTAAAVQEAEHYLTVGADLLGIYPVYYWTDTNGVVLVATSPELFRAHPRFTPELNITGLVGILLSNGLVDGQTLWRNVRRLTPGRCLRVEGIGVWEEEAYQVPMELTAVDLPFAGHVEQLHASVKAAVKRHAPTGRPYGLLLSGGLDSRLLAGYLAEQNARIEPLTFGQSQDIEMRCARAVTTALGLKHHTTEVPAEAYAEAAQRLARWEVLAAGFNGVPEWAMHEAIGSLSDRVVAGHIFDGVIGGIHIGWAYDPGTGQMGFEKLLPTVLAWGFEPEVLKTLLVHDVHNIVDDVMARLQQEYEGVAESEHYRAWLFDLQHRQRFHVGSAIWPISFAAWPVMPFLDRDVMAVSAAMPSSSIADRRAQIALLVRQFPQLAQLPIDRNSYDILPLSPRFRDLLARSFNYRAQAIKKLVRAQLGKAKPERVYYRRLYDINSPGWLSVRQIAEPYRNQLPAVFLRDKVNTILPGVEEYVQVHNPVKDTSSVKTLLGMALCNRRLKTQ